MGFAIDIGAGSNAPIPPLQPASANVAAGRASAQGTSEQSSADSIGSVVTSGTQDGLTATYDPVAHEIDFVNTDKGSVAVTAHEADADPHTQYVEDGDTLAVGLTAPQTVLTPGVAPATPVDGTVWTTTAGIFVQIAGSTVGPLAPASASGGTALISGGGVAFVSSLDIIVSAAEYLIQGVSYSSPETALTAATADPTYDRLDVVIVDDTGAASILTGTPAPNPQKPTVDPDSQLELTFFLVAAAAGSPAIIVTDVYREGTEWAPTSFAGTIVVNDTTDPLNGTKDIAFNSAPSAAYMRLVGSSQAADAIDQLVLYVKPGAWAGVLQVTLRGASGLVGNAVNIKHGALGFNTANPTYQQVVIPMAAFAATGLTFTTIQLRVAGTGGLITAYVDDISLQSGLGGGAGSDRMRWRGSYSSSVLYQTNDVVIDSGTQYVAVSPGAGNSPASSPTYWQASSGAGGAGLYLAKAGDTATGLMLFPKGLTVTREATFAEAAATGGVDSEIGYAAGQGNIAFGNAFGGFFPSGALPVGTTVDYEACFYGAGTGRGTLENYVFGTDNNDAAGSYGFASIGTVENYFGGVTTFGRTIVAPASVTARAPLRIPHGVAPTTGLTNGDVWTTTAGLFVRVNGTTIGPLLDTATIPPGITTGMVVAINMLPLNL